MILVDSSVWIDFLVGADNPETEYLSQAMESEVPIFYTGIILQEVLQGFLKQKQQALIRSEFQKLLQVTPSLEDHIFGAEIYTKCRSQGFTVRKSIDCLIAALALEYQLSLLDRDKGFEAIATCVPLRRVMK